MMITSPQLARPRFPALGRCFGLCLRHDAPLALQAAEKVAAEGIDAEVVDLRTLYPWIVKPYQPLCAANESPDRPRSQPDGGYGA